MQPSTAGKPATGNPKKIGAPSDLCGLAVSAAAGTTSVDQVTGAGDFSGRGLNDACLQSGKNEIDLHTYATELDAVQALLDATVVAYLGNANFVSQYPDLIEDSPASIDFGLKRVSRYYDPNHCPDEC